MILKLELLVYQNIYFLFNLFLYSYIAISTQTNPKSVLGEKKLAISEYIDSKFDRKYYPEIG